MMTNAATTHDPSHGSPTPAVQPRPRRPIPVSGPWITRREIDYVTDAVTHGWYQRADEYPRRFELSVARYLGVRHAVALPSCTSAIHLALKALGVGAGDEVIVPEITWIGSSAPIHYVGAEPVFADIDPRSWCLCPVSLERRISERTKAIIAVDLYGGMPDMEAIRRIARRHAAQVIEDAAQALGSRWRGAPAGSLGDVGVFSFHGSKTATTGEGGMLVTNCPRVYGRVLSLRDHGRQPGDNRFLHAEIAFKYKMSALQAALGLAQVERIEELVQRKRQIFAWYRQHLDGVPGLTLNWEPPPLRSTFWMVTVLVDPRLNLPKQQLAQQLAQRGIDTRPFFYPLSALPAYRGTTAARDGRIHNPVAYALSPYGINLPSGMNMTRSRVAYVAQSLIEILRSASAMISSRS